MAITPSNADDLSTSDTAAQAAERPCPDCGEMVRKGLVRCWNCGAFMDPQMQKRYEEMQRNPAPTIFSQVPQAELTPVTSAEEDDFQTSSMSGSNSLRSDLGSLESFTAPPTRAAASAAPEPSRPKASEDATGSAHSVATGGDVLLQVALLEEREVKEKRRRKPLMTGGARTATGFIVFCPYGCRIEVKEQNRGMSGRCPRCKAPFIVPVDPPDYVARTKPDGGAAAPAAQPQFVWIDDLHVHTVSPEKLKLKADSLLKDFAEYDVGVSPQGLVLVSLAKKAGGLLRSGGGGPKNKDEARTAVREHVHQGKPPADAPGGDKLTFTTEQLGELRVVQPASSRTDSLFHGIPVFGEGRIALQLPFVGDGPPRYISMGVTQFRKLSQALSQALGIEPIGGESGIPMEDEFKDVGRCHYLSTPVRALQHLEFYKADPTVELIHAGWKCAGCGLVISEDARAKEKLGGKGGKGLAKTKCPKCTQKFGEQPFFTIKEAADQTSMSGEPAGAEA